MLLGGVVKLGGIKRYLNVEGQYLLVEDTDNSYVLIFKL